MRVLADPDHYNKLRHGAWVKSNQFTLNNHIDGLERVLAAAAPVNEPAASVPAP